MRHHPSETEIGNCYRRASLKNYVLVVPFYSFYRELFLVLATIDTCFFEPIFFFLSFPLVFGENFTQLRSPGVEWRFYQPVKRKKNFFFIYTCLLDTIHAEIPSRPSASVRSVLEEDSTCGGCLPVQLGSYREDGP